MRRRRAVVHDCRFVGCACLVCLCVLWSAARWSVGVQGLLSATWAFPGVPGLPRLCGSDARSTWLWMNPRQYERRNGSGWPLFVVGCGHSGTTPLVSVLALHPQIWLYAPNEALEYSVKPNSFRRAGLVASRNDADAFRRLARRAKPNATRWLVKSPSNVCRLGYVWSNLGSARVVGLVRDGRDVMLSLMARYRDADPAGPFCLGRWVNDNTALLVYEADPRLFVVRYEDLFVRTTLVTLLRHVGVSVAPLDAMLAAQGKVRVELATYGRTTPVASPDHTALRKNQTARPFDRAPPRWPTQMSPSLARVFAANKEALRLLDYFGYLNASNALWLAKLRAA